MNELRNKGITNWGKKGILNERGNVTVNEWRRKGWCNQGNEGMNQWSNGRKVKKMKELTIKKLYWIKTMIE